MSKEKFDIKQRLIPFVLSPKRFTFIAISAFIFTVFIALNLKVGTVSAAPGINRTINFQGKVVNSNGTNVADGQYTFVFRIYNASSGGSHLWTETQNNVTVTAGVFRVALGSVSSISGVDFNTDELYLGINFNSDGEMSPRIRFASVPYAFNAEKVSGLTVTNTTGTLTIPDSETIQFGGSFTTSAQDLILTLTGSTNVTLPTTGTLATLGGVETLSNKSFSTAITFDGVSSDITTGVNESLVLAPNGSGNVAITTQAGGQSALIIDKTGEGDILSASSSGVTKFTVKSDGNASSSAGFTVDGVGGLQSTLNQTLTIGGSSTGNIVFAPGNNLGSLLPGADSTIDLGASTSARFRSLFLSPSSLHIQCLTGDGCGQNLDYSLGVDTSSNTFYISANRSVGVANQLLSITEGGNVNIAGLLTSAGMNGAGLVDCDSSTSKLLWNDATGTFSCGTDMGSNLQVQSYTDTNTEVATFTVAMDIWDGTYPNITPGDTSSSVLVSVNIRGTSDEANDHNPVFTIRRNIDTNPSCTDTQVGGEFVGGFLTTITQDWGASVTFADTPSSTGNVRYTVCTTATGLDDANTDVVNVVLTEIGSSSAGGGGGGNVAVRETDASPAIATASTIEFGPASSSSDEFIVSDEGGGTARVRIGDQVGMLNQVETVTGGWTFSSDAQFNGGITSASGTNLSLTPGGVGDFILNLDADTNAQFTAGVAPTVDIFSLSNSSFGTTTNNVDGLQVDFETASVIGARSNSAVQINVTSGATEGSDSLYGINIGNLTGAGAGSETAIAIGTGWDTAVNTNNGNINAGSGTIFASNLDAVGASALGIGSADVTALTIVTDGTGDNEVVLPSQSIGSSELVNDSITASQLSSTITLSDGDLVDFSAITHNDSAPQGIILPQATSLTSPSSGEGYIAWNSSSNLVQVYNGSNWVSVGSSYDFDDIYATSVTNTNTTLEIDDSLGLTIDLTTTGNFTVSDAGTAFVQFLNDGAITLGKSSAAGTINIGTGTGIDTINIGTGATGVDVISIGGGSGTLGVNTTNFTLTTAGLLTLYDTIELSGGASEGIRGGGLSDCDGLTAKLLWDSTTNKFSCGTDSYISTTFDAYDNAGGQTVNGSAITLNIDTIRRNNANYTLSADQITINSDGTYEIRYEGTVANATGTIGDTRFYLEVDTGGGFTLEDGSDCRAYNRDTTNAGTCGRSVVMDLSNGDVIRLRAIAGSGTGTTVADSSSITVSKLEDTVGGGGGASSLAVRESDSSPTASGVDTIEFGPASSSTDEFIVTDEGGGVARVRIGNQIGILNQAESVTGGWTFSGSSSIFSSDAQFNGGITSVSGTNLSITPGGTADLIFNLDADTNAQFAAGAAPAVDILTLSNSTFGTTTNGVDGVQIDFETAAIAGARSNSAVRLNVTSGATEASDTLYGINIASLTSPSSGVETGIIIGSSWDIALDAGTGTIVASNWDGSGTANLTAGSADTQSLTITTDGTGDGEVVLPSESISATEILSNTITATQIASSLTFSDGDLVDLSSITHSTTAVMGLKLPQANSLSNPSSGEGFFAWDTDDNRLQVFNGSVWRDAGVTTFDAIYSESVARADVNMAISDGAGLIFDLTSSGDFEVRDGGTAIATFGSSGSLTFSPNGTGNLVVNVDANSSVGIGTSLPLGTLDVRGALSAAPAATISAQTSSPALLVDNNGDGDILRIQKSGATKFSVLTTGDVRISNLNAANCDVKADGTGLLSCGTDVGTDGYTVNVYTADATWNAPTDLSFAQVIVTGSGGGGGEGETQDTASEAGGGGGGSGGTSIEMVSSATLGSSQSVTVGAGGAGGTGTNNNVVDAASNGNASSFGSLLAANGGSAGSGVSTAVSSGASGGAGGGADSSGDVNLAGGGGSDGQGTAESPQGGDGGSSYWGGGGGGARTGGNNSTAGTNSGVYGTGGGGGASEDIDGAASGGSGVDGVVVVVSYTSSGADLAEWYETKENVEEGDIVAVSEDQIEFNSRLGLAKNAILEKATGKNGLVGVVSTAPFQTMGSDILGKSKHPKPIALAGRVPVKVSSENGEVKSGDLLTVSSIPGVAKRSTKAGETIGRAISDPRCVDGKRCVVDVLVNTAYSNGILVKGLLSEEGIDLDAIPKGLDQSRVILAKLIQDKENVIASGEAELHTDRVVAGVEVITPTLVAHEGYFDKLFPANDDISIVLDKGNLVIGNSTQSALTVFDGNGNASISGTLSVGKIKASSIEGLEIISNSISVIEDSLGIVGNKVNLADNQKELEETIASISARLDKLGSVNLLSMDNQRNNGDLLTAVDNLAVYGTSTLSEVSVLEAISVGIGTTLTIGSHSIDTIGESLSIQSLKQGSIEFLGSLITFESDGTAQFSENVTFRKDVSVGGVLSASTISATSLLLGQGEVHVLSDTEVESTAAAGLVTLKKDKDFVKVFNPLVKNSSYIFITPKSATSRTLFLLEQSEVNGENKSHFVVGIDRETPEDIKFNYLIVN